MKMLTKLIEKAEDTLDEIEWYGEKALMYREENKALADVYNKIADMHINIYDMLHKQMVELIDQYKRNGATVPAEMSAIWNYEHEKLIKEFKDAKVLVDEYKRY